MRLSLYFKKIYKMWQWYTNVFKNDYDFDGHSLLNLINYKLKRLDESMRKGYCEHSPSSLKAIRIAIKLSSRCYNEMHTTKAQTRHQNKWGKLECWTTPEQDSNLYRFHSSHPKAVFEKQKKQCLEDRLSGIRTATQCANRDRRNLFAIVNKYLDVWWD